MKTSPELSLHEMTERAWRAWPRILAFWALAAIATLVILLWWPRTYGSSAKLLLNIGRESIGLDPTVNAAGKTIGMQQAGRDSEIKSAIDILRSRGMLEAVVDKLTPEVVLGESPVGQRQENPLSVAISRATGALVGLVRSIDPTSKRERAVIEVEKHLLVNSERKSEVVTITFEAETPELARMVVQELVHQYQRKRLEFHRTVGSTEFFDAQSERLRQELDAAAGRLRDAKNRMGLASISGQRKILETQLGDLRNDMLLTEKQLSAAEAKNKNLQSQLTGLPERQSSQAVTKPNAGADLQRQLLYALQIQEADARAKFTDNHPTVRALQQQVAAADAELKSQVTRIVESTDDINPLHRKLTIDYAETTAELAGLRARRDKLVAQQEDILRQIKDLNAFELEVNQLERDVAVASRKYVIYAESLEESRIDLAMQQGAISSVSVVQPATLQEKPVSPSKPITLLLGCVFCGLGALVIAFVNIQFDDRLTSANSLREQLKVPVLGTLPQAPAYSQLHI